MENRTARWASTLTLIAGTCTPVWAVSRQAGQPNSPPAPVASGAFPYVGRVQSEDVNPAVHHCTGSAINIAGFSTGTTVLTASHCINEEVISTNPTVYALRQNFDRFTLPGGAQLFGLGVQHPTYGPAGLSNVDIGMILLLNAPAATPVGTIASAANDGTLANGQAVSFLGFTGSAPNGNPLLGQSTINSLANPQLVIMNGAPANHFIQGGDSGGPTLRNFGTAGTPNWQIISVHRSSVATNPATWDDVRVQPNAAFVDGSGVGGARHFNQFVGANNADWETAAGWGRRVAMANVATKPQNGDVVILDPTRNSDAGTNVNITTANTNNIDGLMTDVTLNINTGRSLNVTGSTGALNGGTINIGTAGGGGTAGTANFAFSLDNVGTVNLNQGAFNAGASLVGGVQTALMNNPGANVNVNGGTATVSTQINNRGTITINNTGTMAVGANLPAAFGGNNPIAIRNGKGNNPAAGGVPAWGALPGTVAVNSGGTLNVSNGGNQTAQFLNAQGSMLTVQGGANGAGTATIDVLNNLGTASANSGGNVTVRNGLYNRGTGTLNISGGANGNGTVTANVVVNSSPEFGGPGGRITVNNGGRLVANGTTTQVAMVNASRARIDIKPGGQVMANGDATNIGTMQIESGAAGIGQFFGNKYPAGAGGANGSLVNSGAITFVQNDGAAKPQIVMDNANFTNSSKGKITGPGRYTLTAETSFNNTRPNGGINNWNDLDVVYDSATTAGGGFVLLEASNTDIGALLGGLGMKFALETLCITGGSKVRLIDSSNNNGALDNEAVYTEFLGVATGSTLDLNGYNLYYKSVIGSHGLNGTVINGTLTQIPGPGALPIFMITGVVASRRRRTS